MWNQPPPIDFANLAQARQIGRWLRHLVLGYMDVPDPQQAAGGEVRIVVQPQEQPKAEETRDDD